MLAFSLKKIFTGKAEWIVETVKKEKTKRLHLQCHLLPPITQSRKRIFIIIIFLFYSLKGLSHG